MNSPPAGILTLTPSGRPAAHYVDRILAALSRAPDQVVLRWRTTSRTAGELRRAVESTAAVLGRRGVGATSTVAVLTAANSPDALVARYAANLLGAAVVYPGSVNPARPDDLLPVERQLDILRETDAAVLVTDAESLDRARRLVDPSALVELGAASVGGASVGDASVGGAAVGGAAVGGAADGTAAVVYTSGMTGRPKGVAWPLAAWNHLVSAMLDGKGKGGAAPGGGPARGGPPPAFPRFTMLITTPLSHTVGPMVDGVLAAGGTVILHEDFDAGEVLRALDEHRASWAFVATPHIYQLLDHPDLATTDLSALRQVVYGGCPASPTRLAEAVRVFGPVLRQSYGTTETWGITALTPPEHLEPELLGTVGRPLPGVQVAVRDPDSGRELAPGETGEVCVRSPSMMDGYWADPDLTARVLREGWVHTGDLGYLDDRGYLHLVDRIADVIKTGGVKVYPTDVEKALTAHPAVAQAAVYGARDADEVEHVYAAVVLRPEADSTTVADLRAHVAATLSPRHAPAGITFCAGLPLTGTGKPDKRALRSGG